MIGVEEAAGGSGQFYVDLASDSGGLPLDSSKLDSLDGTGSIVLCTNLLVDHLTALRKGVEMESADEEIFRPSPSKKNNLAFYDHLLRFWWEKPERVHDRKEQLTWIRAAFGISAAHHFVKGETQAPSAQITTDDSEENIELSDSYRDPNSGSGNGYTAIRCQLADHSKGGFALTLANNAQAKLRVGEVLAIQPSGANNSQKWHIGVVRWFSRCGDYETRVGVQHISSAPQAILVSGVETTTPDGTGILLKDVKLSERERQIIAPPGTFSDERELKLGLASDTLQARADRLLESTASFDLFTCLLR